MGKKVREYKSGDFIFAKVKGYPAWPARVQKSNGKKYFVYFYGTGETANLSPAMIFDYAENKDKFLTKTVKRRDFNDGVKQIEHDFANNVPLEQVIGGALEAPAEANDVADDTANETMDDSAIADTTADDTAMDESTANATADANAVEDSDDAGALVIDEGKKGRKSKVDAKTPAKEKEAPAKGKEPKTPRAKAKKDEAVDDEEKKDEELVSRSGRKIRPKRYIDEQTEDNATLPSPVPKKRRGVSPSDKDTKDKPEAKDKPADKSGKLYNAVTQSELEELKEPFKQGDPEKDNILITYLPTGQYVGIKLFQSRPNSFKNEASRLQWDKQAASNAITLKLQLERGQITPQSILAQLVMDLNLTDEEKASLDKERETEEKKCRVQFLKTEMKLIELDAKIKTCLCLEKADTELCLKLLDELMELEVRPLMLLKHPTCLETVKRMRAYVGNTPSWDLTESAALVFNKQAHRIRKQADTLYKNMKELFTTPDGLSFWEYFSERVLQFKKATAKLSADELLQLVHEPLELTMPSALTMKSAIDAANEEHKEDEEDGQKKKTPVKPKKTANSTPAKPPLKRQSSRKQQQEEKEKDKESKDAEEPAAEENKEDAPEKADKEVENNVGDNQEAEAVPAEENKEKEPTSNNKEKDANKAKSKEKETKNKEKEIKNKEAEAPVKEAEETEPQEKESEKVSEKTKEKSPSPSDKEKNEKKDNAKEDKPEEKGKEDKDDVSEPRAKRSRESKKTEAPPPRSPAKRKSKF